MTITIKLLNVIAAINPTMTFQDLINLLVK